MAFDKSSSEGESGLDPVQKLQSEASELRREAEKSLAHAKELEEENQRRHAQLELQEQQLTPMTINNLRVHGAPNTRRTFLDPIFNPLLDPTENTQNTSTLGTVSHKLESAISKLSRLGIFQPSPPPQVYLAASQQTDPSASPTDVDIDMVLRELPRYKFNAGTDVGNSEGSAFTSLLWRNALGGGEQLTLNASAGTRTRSAYTAELSAPLRSDQPERRAALELLSSATDKPWAGHEEVLRGAALRYQWADETAPTPGATPTPPDAHSLELTTTWRQITSLSGTASPTVRLDAGDTLKTSLRHIFRRERRDNPQLPQRGYHVRSTWELAGVGPLGLGSSPAASDVAFSKSDLEVGGAVPLPLPLGVKGASLGAGLRMGMLYPLAPGFSGITGDGLAQPSRVNDRFQLGGPTDVRGFKLGGLGPHDGVDAVGGDVFAAGSVNALFPLPYKGADSALRFQVFANGGRMVAMSRGPDEVALATRGAGEGQQAGGPTGLTAGSVTNGMVGAVTELFRGPPSVATGVGLVYAHPVARFELNFSLPLVLRRGEVGTKGVQVGVGINFL